jgi:hypothetical protein
MGVPTHTSTVPSGSSGGDGVVALQQIGCVAKVASGDTARRLTLR